MTNFEKGNEEFLKGNYKPAALYFEKALKENALTDQVKFNLELCKKKLNEELVVSQKKISGLKALPDNCAYEAHLDYFDHNRLQGWAVKKDDPSALFDLHVKLDGVVFCTAKNDLIRRDLKVLDKSSGHGGFSVSLPDDLFPSPFQTLELILPDGHVLLELLVPQQASLQSCSQVRSPVKSAVSVIVPIYNAPEDLEVCIERLVKYTSPSVDIILIDDASTNKRIPSILEAAKQHKNIRVYSNELNLGFTKTVNRGIELAGTNDVVFLNSDARVTPRWLEGLKAALATDNNIATVTPMSDRAGAFSAPNMGNDNNLPIDVKEEDYAVAFRRRSVGSYPTVPTGNGFCLYVRRACLDEIGVLDETAFPRGYGEENDFCMRARSAGWRNVIDDRTYVFHDRNKSFGKSKDALIIAGRKVIDERYPDYSKAISVFSQSPLINMARYRARLALKDIEKKILPRGLFVISTLMGGTPQTNRDLMLSLSDDLEPWLLHCDRSVISLYRVNRHGDDELTKQHVLKEPIEPLTHTSSEYDQVLFMWLTEMDFELVHIRHLAWHSFNLPKLAKQAGARVIKSFHDYYAVCPTIKLLDDKQQYCGGTCTKSRGECLPELWASDAFPYLKDNWIYKWRDQFKRAVECCDVYITTHESSKATILEHLDLDEKKFHVIPHGRDFNEFCQLAEPYKQGDLLKVLVPGNINDAKGSQLILELLRVDSEGLFEFHILGKAFGELGAVTHPNLIVHGEYERDDFAEHVKKIKPHIGAVLSIWNETWCHTLTELWSVGLPVVVTNYPTVADRVNEHGGGWVAQSSQSLDVMRQLNTVASNPDSIKFHIAAVLSLQGSQLSPLNNRSMASQYWKLYGY